MFLATKVMRGDRESGNLPFRIVENREEGDYQARNFTHIIKDTEARPGMADFEKLAKGCDLLVIPAVPVQIYLANPKAGVLVSA